jgi:hypothetical protein
MDMRTGQPSPEAAALKTKAKNREAKKKYEPPDLVRNPSRGREEGKG